MEFKANYAKIVGTPGKGEIDSWVLVEDGLFLVLEISRPSSETFPSVAAYGKDLIDNLLVKFHDLGQKNLVGLKQMMAQMTPENNFTLAFVLGMQVGKVIYFISLGAGRVIIRRKGEFGVLLSETGDTSGLIEDQDIFLLVSPRFSEIVSFDEIKNTFEASTSLSTISELAESLTSLVHRAEDTSGVACLILQFTGVGGEEWERDEGGSVETIGEANKPEIGNWQLAIGKLISLIQRKALLIQRPTTFYLRQPASEEEKKKRTISGIALILIILLMVSIFFGLSKR